MEPGSALSTSAQIAIAIAGFAGVVAAFRSDSVRDWGQVEKFWLRLLLINSILALAFSMFGLLFLAVDAPLPATWRWSSAVAALFLIPYAVSITRTLAGFAPGQLEAAGGANLTSYGLVGILIGVCLLQLLNMAMLAEFWPFFCAVVGLVLGAMYQFVRLVLIPQRP
jgi:hypothetical protein